MPPPNLNIQPLLDQAKTAGDDYKRTGSYGALFRMITLYGEVNKVLMDEAAQKARSPMDPLINTAGARLGGLRQQVNQAGEGDPPPGLLAKIQIATQAYQAWNTALRSIADSKGEVQKQLARF